MKTKILVIKIDKKVTVIKRVNKYVVLVKFDDGQEELVHLHDPGRLLDIVYEKNQLLLQYKGTSKTRKTAYDIIAGKSNDSWVLIHSSYPNYIVEELLKKHSSLLFDKELLSVKREVKNGDSRFDFLVEDNLGEMWIEVKGCTFMDEKRVAKFPDAPTLRGQKHIKHLTEMVENGTRCAIIFVITQSTAQKFEAYKEIDPVLAERLKQAKEIGVKIFPIVFSFVDGEVCFERVLEFF